MSNASSQFCEDLLLFLGRVKHELIMLAEERNMTVMQLSALFAINREGQLAMGRVAEVLHCDASNVTGIVDRLVAQDLVIRHECEHDRRTKTLQLTAKGKRVVDIFMDSIPGRVGCAKLSLQERNTFQTLMQKISL